MAAAAATESPHGEYGCHGLPSKPQALQQLHDITKMMRLVMVSTHFSHEAFEKHVKSEAKREADTEAKEKAELEEMLSFGDMDIIIVTMTQKHVRIRASSTHTIESLKLLVQDSEGIPPDQQRLIYAGKQLEDKKTLADYNIQRNAKLMMVLRLRGGMMHRSSGHDGDKCLTTASEAVTKFMHKFMAFNITQVAEVTTTEAAVSLVFQIVSLVDQFMTYVAEKELGVPPNTYQKWDLSGALDSMQEASSSSSSEADLSPPPKKKQRKM